MNVSNQPPSEEVVQPLVPIQPAPPQPHKQADPDRLPNDFYCAEDMEE